MWFHRSLTVLLLCLVNATGNRDKLATTPVQKVVNLLIKLRDKIQEEGKEEAAGYDKFACFCKKQTDDKQHAIDKSDTRINGLTASRDALAADIAELDSQVAAKTTELQQEQSQGSGGAATRQAARAVFQEKQNNLTQAVAAIKSAISTLQASRDTVRGVSAAALLARLPAQVASLVEVAAETGAPGDAPAYQYRASDIIATLQSLLQTFKGQLSRIQEEEAAAQHSFEMVEGARAQKIAAIQSEIDQKQRISASKNEDKSAQEGQLAEETAARAADRAFMDELTQSCQAKAQAWDARSRVRASELTTITQALGELQGMGDVYQANRRLVGLQERLHITPGASRSAAVAPHQGSVSLLQVDPVPQRVEAALNLLARNNVSSTLLALARNASTGGDPFVRVRSLVKDLISKLQAEATSEATAKSLCDTSMRSAITKRDQYQAQVESLSADIDIKKSEINVLTSEVTELAEQIADLHKALNDLTSLRLEEQARNNRTVADADAGAVAVRQAIAILQQFYSPSLLQVHNTSSNTSSGADRDGNTVGDLAPDTFSGDYRGKTAESKGIIGLLEVIASDFERTSSTTGTAEAAAVSAFQAQSQSLNSDITAKTTEKGGKETSIQTKEADLITLEDDLKTQQQLHTGALEELAALETSCVSSGESWQERKRRREQEVEALKEALAVLESWNT